MLTASGTLVLNVPYDLKDNVTQIISLMQVKRIGGNTIVDVTPPVDLSIWTKTAEGTDNVTYLHYRIFNSLIFAFGSRFK